MMRDAPTPDLTRKYAMTYPADFLLETSHTPPCGEDLTYDAEFLAMESAARGKSEQQFGDTVIPAEPPDWRVVERQAATLMARTKDVRIAAILCRAWTNVRGLAGTAQGLQLVADLMERYWEHVHPLPEDGVDHYMRMNAVAVLADVTGLVRELRDTEFLRATFGSVSVRDAEALARGHAGEANDSVSLDQLRVGVGEALSRGDETVRAVTSAGEALSQIQSLCASRLAPHQLPELDPLKGLLQTLREVLPRVDATGSAQASESGDQSVGATGPQLVAHGQGVLRNREEAIDQLLRIAEFVEQTEPTNPAPLLIHRAVKLMRMSFIDILRELAPECLSQVEVATGMRQ